ncbi:MAG TPA: NADP-dependent oxidoreductase [Candidatus Saccharimonadales bacterium]|nr:NADP-dependent oxidoreductase [Candidatus Saccharimonadales bacterium]
MKAAQISEYGHADKIQIVEVAKPSVKPGGVLVEVHAASVNPWDIRVREGAVKDLLGMQLPVTLGGDFAGIVQEVGDGVDHLKRGDNVYGQAQASARNSGALAEFAVTQGREVARMPRNVDFVTAAVAPLTGLSAVQVIMGHMQLHAGQKILIHGGAGGIGTIAIQIAKHLGAYVAATATGDGIAYVRSLGADEVIDYKTQNFEALHDFDAVYDTVGGSTYERSFKVVHRGGMIVSMVEQPNENLMNQYGVTAIHQLTQTSIESLDTLTKLIEDGAVTIHVDKVFPLEQVQQAFQALETGSVKGKVAVSIASSDSQTE